MLRFQTGATEKPGTVLALLISLLSTAGAAGAAEDFPLVAGGRAAPIVVDPTEALDPDLAQALADLRSALARATGIEPEIVSAPERPAGPVVLLGRAAGLAPREEELTRDGYLIKATAGHVALAGPTSAGTANAVYDLLETAAGVLFLAPGPEGMSIPGPHGMRTDEIRIPAGERRERPAFLWRSAEYDDSVLEGSERAAEREALRLFARRNRASTTAVRAPPMVAAIVPPDRYFVSNPDYFAEVGGHRVPDGQLCTSHPYVGTLAAVYWIDRFSREPGLQIGSLSPNEGGGYCTCARCRVIGPDLATRITRFMDETARRVAAVHPDRLLVFDAAGHLAEPPHGRGLRLDPSLIPIVSRRGACQVHPITSQRCASSAAFRRRLAGWAAVAPRIAIHEDAAPWPVPDLGVEAIRAGLAAYRELGAIGVRRTYLHRGFLTDLLQAVDLHLQWNPAADGDSLLAAALSARFGRAAPDLQGVATALSSSVRGVPPEAVIPGDVEGATEIFAPATLGGAVERLDRLAATPELGGRVRALVAAEADLLRAAELHLAALVAVDRAKQTGRAADRSAALEALKAAAAAARPAAAAGRLRARTVADLEDLRARLASPGLTAPLAAGAFDYEDDMSRGGFSRRDSRRIDGFQPARDGLTLPPGSVGRIAYLFRARASERFERAELYGLRLDGSPTRVEVKVDGAVHAVGKGWAHDDPERVHDLTPLVGGAERFTLIFWAQNSSQQAILSLDHWGVRGVVGHAGHARQPAPDD